MLCPQNICVLLLTIFQFPQMWPEEPNLDPEFPKTLTTITLTGLFLFFLILLKSHTLTAVQANDYKIVTHSVHLSLNPEFCKVRNVYLVTGRRSRRSLSYFTNARANRWRHFKPSTRTLIFFCRHQLLKFTLLLRFGHSAVNIKTNQLKTL